MRDTLTPQKLLMDFVYPVLPSGGGKLGKSPLIEWKEFQNSFPTPEDLEKWEKTYHPSLWGIVTGSESGVVVFDLDQPESKSIFEVAGLSPHIKTPRGGYHYWFRHPGTHIKTVSGLLPGLDVRGDGGFVNVIGKRQDGEYQTLIPPSPDTVYPWDRLPTTIREALNNNHSNISEISPNKPGWVGQLLMGVGEGLRNDSATRLAGYFRNLHPKDVTESILLAWNGKNTPPLPNDEILKTINSVYKLPEHPPILSYDLQVITTMPCGNSSRIDGDTSSNSAMNNTNGLINNKLNNISKPEGAFIQNSFTSGQVSGQVVDKLERFYGELSEPFDRFLSENPEPHWRKEVAEIIGTTYKDPAFIKLVQRRMKEGNIRSSSGGDKIQWVNREWQRSIVQLDTTVSTFTNLSLPFGGEKFVAIPGHAQIVVAGDIGSGKTHYGYEFAEINAGKMTIRHFFNEIGAFKAKRNLEDFPNLSEHYGRDYFLIDLDRDGIDVADNLDPNGLNIYDYLHLSDTKEWFLTLQHDLTRLSQKLEKGVICVMLQKKRGSRQAMGGDSTRMQCEVYLTLNIEQNQDTSKECRVDIEKAKDWVTSTNPENLCCRYKTVPKWGKLEKIGEWQKKPMVD
jgi:hypothetical protein